MVEGKQVADLEREKQDRAEADGHEDADPEVDRGAVHATFAPRNMNTVSTKSSARIASEETTTVRVVALDDALGGRLGVIALEHRDQRNGNAENDALDDAVGDVGPEVDAGLHLAPERAGVDSDQPHADEVAAENAERRKQRRQQRHGNDAAPEARRDDPRERVDRHHLHRRELLGRLHEADLGGDRRAGAAREQQARDHRPQFAHQRQRDQDPELLVGAVALERLVALQRQHHADEQARHQDDDQRQHAGEVDLAQREMDAPERVRRVPQHRHEEAAGKAQLRDGTRDRRAQAAQPLRDFGDKLN